MSTIAVASAPRTLHARRPIVLALSLAALAVLALLSLGVGARHIAPADTLRLLLHPDGSTDALVLRDLRVPRTLLGLLVGAALGIGGALMQALTRNPLADPGLLGVNAGAAAAVVAGMVVLGAADPSDYVWLALLGAGAALVLVHALGMRGAGATAPVRLALAGTAISAALTAVITGVVLLRPGVFDLFRAWELGSLSGRGGAVTLDVVPFIAVGLVLAFGLARSLNALALGDESGRALGVHVGRTRALGALAVTLLCGAATAAAGPIGFIGLAAPHMARALTGPDQRWALALTAVLAPCLLLAADVLGRLLGPGELQVGVVSAVLGAPLFVFLVRRYRIGRP